jgi:LAO/AO transport system kinase
LLITLLCSALQNEGIADIWDTVLKYVTLTKKNNFFKKKRNEQNKFWLLQSIEDKLKSDFFNNSVIKKELQHQLQLIENNQTTPFAAAETLLNLKL